MTDDRRYDVAVIGAGVVGTAIARQLARYRLRTVLLERANDVGTGTSKANTAIVHTGFDTQPGSLESSLVRRGHELLTAYARAAGIALEETGAVLVAWNAEQAARLDDVARQGPGQRLRSAPSGWTSTSSPDGSRTWRRGRRGPSPSPTNRSSARGARASPSPPRRSAPASSSGSAWTSPTSGATARSGCCRPPGGPVRAGWVVNAAGLGADLLNRRFGHDEFTIAPRRGQLIVFDKLARGLVSSIVLPVPTERTKGVLVAPTVYGNVLLGPTAEDIEGRDDTATTAAGLDGLLDAGRRIVPDLVEEEVTATYAGIRAATEHRDYQITIHEQERYACVGGIRSTGLTASLAIAEHVVDADGGRRAARWSRRSTSRSSRTCPSSASVPPGPSRTTDWCGRSGLRPHRVLLRARHRRRGARRARRGGARHRPRGPAPAHPRHQRALSGLLLRRGHRGPAGGSGDARDPHRRVASTRWWSAPGPPAWPRRTALRAGGAGRVMVLDREDEAGGTPRLCEHTGFGLRDLRRVLSGPAYARRWVERAAASGVDIRTRSMVTGWAGPGRAEVTGPDGLLEVDARAVVLATGAAGAAAGRPPGSGNATLGDLHDRPAPAVGAPPAPAPQRAGAHRRRRARLVLGGADPARSGRPPGRAGDRPPAHADVPPLRPRDPRRPPRAGLDRDIRDRGDGARPTWTGCSSAAPTAPNAPWPSTSSSSPGTSSPTTSWPAWPTSRWTAARRARPVTSTAPRARPGSSPPATSSTPPRRRTWRRGAPRRSGAPPPRGCATVTAARPGLHRSALRVADPLLWVAPNLVEPGRAGTEPLLVRTRAFLDHPRLDVTQGGRLLVRSAPAA